MQLVLGLGEGKQEWGQVRGNRERIVVTYADSE